MNAATGPIPVQGRLPRAALSRARFFALWRWECTALLRRPLLWCLLLAMALAMVLGARAGASLHGAQSAAQAQAARDDAAWIEQLLAQVRRDDIEADEPLPYWQDPTDVGGFSRYMLRVQAMKPHLPASPLAVGQSDLLPSRVPVKLETLFGLEPTYDAEPPRALALGRFDLGFVLVQLMPLALLFLVALTATFERDHGMLRLVAAQPVSARAWLGARMLALATWVLPGLVLSLLHALWSAGVPFAQAMPELLAACVLVAAYAACWLAAGFVLVAALPHASAALLSSVALWAALCLGGPVLLAAGASWLSPSPSRMAYIDAQRRATDAVQADRAALIEAAFAADPLLSPHIEKAGTLDYATRLYFLAPMIESRLADRQAAFVDNATRQQRWSVFAGYLVPALGMDRALSTLAGTDAERHRRFEVQVRDYQGALRDFFGDHIRMQIARPTPRGERDYLRKNFTEHRRIPAFAMVDDPWPTRVGTALAMAAWLSLLAAALVLFAGRRLRRWPKEI
jgi:ABC-2 type transport system permease protein